MEIGLSRRNVFPFSWVIWGGILILAVIVITAMFSYQNDEAKLVNEFKAQEQKIEAVHDQMWKVIRQKAGIAKEYSAQFDSIYTHIMDKRYSSNDGVLFNWIKESNPNFSPELYKELSVSIEVQRKQFLGAQEKTIDIVREQNNMLDIAPGKWFLSGRKRLKYEVISSTNTKHVMDTRLDDNIDLF